MNDHNDGAEKSASFIMNSFASGSKPKYFGPVNQAQNMKISQQPVYSGQIIMGDQMKTSGDAITHTGSGDLFSKSHISGGISHTHHHSPAGEPSAKKRDDAEDAKLLEDFSFRWKNNTDDAYDLKGDRGYVLIISNTFDSPNIENPAYHSKKRSGATGDADKMANLFKLLKFKPRVETNVGKKELEEIVNETKEEVTKDGKYHSFFFIMMSHGGVAGHSILMADEELNEVNLYEDIVYKLIGDVKDQKYEVMPKVFIVQACQDQELPKEIDGNNAHSMSRDTLICHSTIPYKVAYRHPANGAYYIEAIDKIFRKQHRSSTLHEMMGKVDQMVWESTKRAQYTSRIELGHFKQYRFKL